jgi:hypothetical protein
MALLDEASPCGIGGGQSGTGTCVPPSTYIFYCHYNPTNALHSAFHLAHTDVLPVSSGTNSTATRNTVIGTTRSSGLVRLPQTPLGRGPSWGKVGRPNQRNTKICSGSIRMNFFLPTECSFLRDRGVTLLVGPLCHGSGG